MAHKASFEPARGARGEASRTQSVSVDVIGPLGRVLRDLTLDVSGVRREWTILRCGEAMLRVRNDGRVELRRAGALVGAARCALPLDIDANSGVVSARGDDEVVVSWGSRVTLVVRATRSLKNGEAFADLDDGFALDFSMDDWQYGHTTAEIVVELAPSGNWFGGAHQMRSHWPLENGCWEIGPQMPFDNGPNGLNTLVSTHWVTSKGVAVVADPDTPYFHVGLNAPKATWFDGFMSKRTFGVGIQNATRQILPFHAREREGDGLLRLQARNSFRKGYGPFSMNHPLVGWVSPKHINATRRHMRVALCANANVKVATMNVLRTLPKPSSAPPKEVFRAPIWTTWAKMKTNVSQRKVLDFAQEIQDNGMVGSVIEIDDKWQSNYGDLEFDLKKFPNPTAMVDKLHELGFKVTLWVMPFIAEDTNAYRDGKDKGYFVDSNARTGFFKWWQSPPVVALDVTNPEAVKWFCDNLRSLQERHGIDGFKFDAGEPCFLPRRFVTHMPLGHPAEYTRAWVNNVASQFELAEVRSGHNSTGNASLVRMGDRFSEWGIENGLGSLIPTLLTSGVMGYPFCLPDIIGGNAYFGKHPDGELMVRWAQANALMPAMQFSLTPWTSGVMAKEMTAAALKMRDQFVDSLIHFSEQAALSLEPICRPLWWLDPEDSETFMIADQFAIGEDVIVAPVVCQGASHRAVYLTAGEWRDITDPDVVYQGGRWIEDFSAPLGKLPIFVRNRA